MKIYKFCLIVLSALFLFSCDKETENLSRLTYYVAFEIKGDNPVIMEPSDEYVDEGCIATLQGKDVTSKITTKMNVVSDAMGLYKVEYSYFNDDKLVSRAVRDVIVCNPNVTADLSGTWTVVEGESYREPATNYGGEDFTVKIIRLAPGFFEVSDFLAGWYDVRAKYGSAYAIGGYIALNEDNTIKLLTSNISPWGVPIDYLSNGIYDPDTDPDVETVKWVTGFGAALGSPMHFHVSLTKEKE